MPTRATLPTPSSLLHAGHRLMSRLQLMAMLLSVAAVLALWPHLPTVELLQWLCVRQGISLARIGYACDCMRHPSHHRRLACAGLTLLDAATWCTLASWITPTSPLEQAVQSACLLAALLSMAWCLRQQLRHIHLQRTHHTPRALS